jgi:ELWxxDGT repeat protein
MQHINPFRKWSWWTALPLLAAFLSTLTLPAQPVLVKDINPNAESGGSSSPTHLCNVNGTLFFVAEDGTNGAELWKSDGTESGTVLVRNIHPSTSGKGPHSLTNVNGTLYFVADDGASGSELWKSDGTAAGTVRLKDIENSALEFEYDGLSEANRLGVVEKQRHGSRHRTGEEHQSPLRFPAKSGVWLQCQQLRRAGRHAVLRGRQRGQWHRPVEE